MSVRVHPGSRREEVRRLDDRSLEVWTYAPALEGRANDAVRRLVASFFEVPPSAVSIATGGRGRTKLVDVQDSAQ